MKVAHVSSMVVVSLLLLSGCGSKKSAGAEEVCKKLQGIADKGGEGADLKLGFGLSGDKASKLKGCIARYESIQKKSPKGYDKLAKCADEPDTDKVLACQLTAVVLESTLLDAMMDADKAVDAQRAEESLKWIDRPTKATEAKLKSMDKEITVTVDLPEGFKEDTSMGGSEKFSVSYELKEEGQFTGPRVTIHPGFGAPDLEQALKISAAGDQKVVNKTSNADGYTLTTAGEFSMEAEVAKKAGENSIECSASFVGKEAVEKKDKFLPWLEKICASVKVK